MFNKLVLKTLKRYFNALYSEEQDNKGVTRVYTLFSLHIDALRKDVGGCSADVVPLGGSNR